MASTFDQSCFDCHGVKSSDIFYHTVLHLARLNSGDLRILHSEYYWKSPLLLQEPFFPTPTKFFYIPKCKISLPIPGARLLRNSRLESLPVPGVRPFTFPHAGKVLLFLKRDLLHSPLLEKSGPWSKTCSGMGEGRKSNSKDLMRQLYDARTLEELKVHKDEVLVYKAISLKHVDGKHVERKVLMMWLHYLIETDSCLSNSQKWVKVITCILSW
jgi:hypothetical protein